MWPVLVVGAGAAGLLAANFAARRGARALLLETRPVPGAKIRVSGGGRCNVLPVRADPSDFHTGGSANTLRNILLSWPLAEVRSFFEEDLGIPLKDEPPGKVFPSSDRSRDVVDALLEEVRQLGVTLLGGRRAEEVEREGPAGDAPFRVRASTGEVFRARRLVLATGGLSLPRTGSDGGGLRLARSLGHTVRETWPALVPLLTSDDGWKALAGISLPARLRAAGESRVLEEREGDFLFTHRGYSGPVVLDLSRHFTVPGGDRRRLLAGWGGSAAPPWEGILVAPADRAVSATVREHLPRRLADRLLGLAGIPEGRRTSQLPRAERKRLLEVLTACPLEVSGDEGFGVAEVTGGGVPLEELHPGTLESRLVPGLHLAGEMLDVVGHIGGYNFLWAWVTGRKAGLGAAEGAPR